MAKDFSQYPLWDLDPTLVHIGSHGIRYYGVIFALGILLGYWFWRKQMTRAGHDAEVTDRFLVWGVLAVLIGSRLGHCLFYEPEYYLRHPLKILEIWNGGLASHGATIGLILALFFYAKRYGFSVMEIFDRFALSATMGAIFVRLGNFMNGEIVGREWYGPWAVRFQRYVEINQSIYEQTHGPLGWMAQALPRHPSQLYEALGATLVFLLILLVDHFWKEKRPRGLLGGMFLVGYFSFRYAVEFFKEFQSQGQLVAFPEEGVIRVVPGTETTIGQHLSVPFILIGVGFLIYAFVKRHPAATPTRKPLKNLRPSKPRTK